MALDDPKTLVSTEWLAAHLNDPDLRILDASWYLPDMGRDGRAEYDAAHIPGARFFDIDEITDARSGLPHMAPPPEKFVTRMRAMGVGDELAHSSIRFGIGRSTTEEEVDYAADRIIETVVRLRDLSPLYEMALEGIDLATVSWTGH